MNFGPNLFNRPAPGSPDPRPAAQVRRKYGLILLTCLGFAVGGLLPATVGGADPNPQPAVNWVLPLFSDRDGHRTLTLRGATVKPTGTNSIAVTDLHITVFSGDAAAKVETVLLSEDATFHPRENRAEGAKVVRVIDGELEVTGEDWTYDHAGKNVSIRRNVRVVYRAPLKPLL